MRDEMRRGVEPGPDARGARDRFEHGGGRAFAVRARDLDRRERALRVAQSLEQPLCVVEAELDGQRLVAEAQQIAERFVECIAEKLESYVQSD